MATKKESHKADVDQQWFFDRLVERQLSLRGLAKLLDMSPSSLSLRLDGTYKITMEEATDLARLLGTTFEEIVLRAGIKIPKDAAKAIKIIGSVGANGLIKPVKGLGTVARPGALPADAVALKGGPEGWTYFCNPSQKLQPEAVGRLAVVENRWLGVLERGAERGLWDVRGVFGDGQGGSKGGIEGVKVGVATPVLLIIP